MSQTKKRSGRTEYQARAKRVRADATADPATVCWLCGQPARQGDPWVAYRGYSYGVDALLPTHRSCSCSAGAKRWHQQGLASLPGNTTEAS